MLDFIPYTPRRNVRHSENLKLCLHIYDRKHPAPVYIVAYSRRIQF